MHTSSRHNQPPATLPADGDAHATSPRNGHIHAASLPDGHERATISPKGGAHKLMPWPTWLEVDLDAVESNVRTIGAFVGGQTRVLAVVKALAYGLGSCAVAEAAIRGGAAGVAVVRVTEGVQLRRGGLEGTILLLGPMGPGEEDDVVRWELTATLVDVDTAMRLAAAADRARKIVPVHIKVDTGLSRFGARPEELLPLALKVTSLAPLLAEGLYTHFASADDDPDFTGRQLQHFMALRELLSQHRYEFRQYHAANSAGLVRCPESHLDMVRPGITVLGAYPSRSVPRILGLRTAFQLKSRVARVYTLPVGTTVGYGRTYRVEAPTRAALIPAGYADGVPRAHSTRAQVLIRGTRVRIIGRVSMDQFVVDASDLPGVETGDEVALIGRQGDDEIDIDEYASWSDTIPHEALTRIGTRIPRFYHRSGSPIKATLLNSADCMNMPESLPLR